MELKGHYKEAAALAGKLEQSLKVGGIWPEAFQNGSCSLRVATRFWSKDGFRGHLVCRAWLVDGAGNTRPLTKDEYACLKPNDTVHPQFEV